MPPTEKLDTHQKALALNLDPSKFGSFAEIGAGQEVARWPLSRLFAQNVRIYAYPMTSKDLQEAIDSLSSTGWEWSETNGWASAQQLHPAPPSAICTPMS